ncbi:MAG: hypothetical protein A2762_06100 [Candidatus Lloydbacteria bacterium RIFCSPHIGHO2_01_FULL_54_11]|nr:MAG: hypothetical protein A2762_06100 [Candidatus Lloydbacteria bacterium RIFCSPHIGHO2_01_FULL_54_11]OGZ13259.1 MAG: hypothetical protein A2948_02940 [Candidatus Lloydbacteria bacterium RIFCSPLOWO2_01_FULL_54_18]OGZ14369.1 MAG: hypothetical protein A3H76_04805 [Candidatus Lloydbacteria bacterium RIFCSPLOWO2_02_FULL_54_12]
MSILDLPIERQRQLAAEMGYADFDEWVKHIRKSLDEGAAYRAKIDAMPDMLDSMSPEDRAHAIAKFSQPIVLFPEETTREPLDDKEDGKGT